jgi:cholesterol oxidase
MTEHAEAPPRRRQLEAGEPEVRPFAAADGVELRLTRYRGGQKGPVLLTHGLGVSSAIFTTDTIRPNLLEFLVAAGYDVWLLDYRASIDLPASELPYDADAIARLDYPAAVGEIRAATGAESLQAVVHCFGSTTFFMAMLAGLEGIRSAVASQVATHMPVPRLTRVKAGLRVPWLLEHVGVRSMTARAGDERSVVERVVRPVLARQPLESEERCDNPVCHRITFLYGLLYEHDRLSEETHTNLHELFGVAGIRALGHLALMVRRGRLVAADGSDAYLPHADRLRIPIRFVHGAENACYPVLGTELSLDYVARANGPELYSRRVIPGYGHIDCIFGEHAARDVYPHVLEHLEETASAGDRPAHAAAAAVRP